LQQPFFIDIEIVSHECGLAARVKPATLPQPIMINNSLKIPIFVYNPMNRYKYSILPDTTSIYATSIQFFGEPLQLFVDDKQISLDIVQFSNSQSNSEYTISLSTTSTYSKLIKFEHLIPKITKFSIMNFIVSIPTFSFSFIDKHLHELCLFTANNILLAIVQEPSCLKAQFGISSFQFDDLHPLATFLVPFSSCFDKSKPFLEISFQMSRYAPMFSHFDYLNIKILPCYVFLDISFLNDMIFSFQSFSSQKRISSLFDHEPEFHFNSSIISAKEINISKFHVNITFSTHTSRTGYHPNSEFYWDLIPSIHDFHLKLPSKSFVNFISTSQFLNSEIINPYISSIKSQIFKAIFNTTIFFNIGGMVSKFSQHVDKIADGNAAAVPGAAASALLGIGEGITSAASEVLHVVGGTSSYSTSNVAKNSKDTAVSGLLAIPKAISKGAKGLIEKPKKGAKKHGAIGAAAGFVQGIIGLAVSPVIGIVDSGATFMSAAKKAVDADSHTFKRMRNVRVFSLKQILPFNKKFSDIQLIIKKSSHWKVFVIYIEQTLDYGLIVALTLQNIYVFSMKNDLSFESSFLESQIEVSENNVRLKKGNQSITFQLKNPYLLKSIFESRSMTLKLLHI
jgi:hypothetical protein